VYRYSNLASWRTTGEAELASNRVAFGVPTPAGGIPLSGTASYTGIALGQADLPNSSWGGDLATTPVDGTVRLTFNFAEGSFAGSLSLGSSCDCDRGFSLGTLSFANSIFAKGGQTFSGSFATTAPGVNGFDGRFTGPQAEEMIGSWRVPFMLDGSNQTAWGAWIAKQGN
jgi:hypothetical protein